MSIPIIQNYKAAIEKYLMRFKEDGEEPVKIFLDQWLYDKIKTETYVTKTVSPIQSHDGMLFGLPYKLHNGIYGELTVIGKNGTIRIQFFNS